MSKICHENEEQVAAKKINYVKFKNELLLNVEKNFFNIFFKITDFNNAETLQYLLKDFSKLHYLLLNIQDEILMHNEKFIV